MRVVNQIIEIFTTILVVNGFYLAAVASEASGAAEPSSSSGITTKHDETVQQLIDWFIAKGGYIHPQVQIRRWNVSDPDSYYGVFVDDSDSIIRKDELLIKVPVSTRLQIADKFVDEYSYFGLICELAWLLKSEYELGDKSEYAPYIQYIKEQSKTQLPAMWSEAGKALLAKVQGDIVMTGLTMETEPGEHIVDWIDEWFDGDACLVDTETNETLEHFYVATVIQRGYDYALFPIYDMINHHNGNVNTENRPSIRDENGFGIYALRDLAKGEELFYSYHDCVDCRDCPEPECESTLDVWGTPEMLRDFGFVEPYPHRFHLEEEDEDLTLIVEKVPNQDNFYDVTCVGDSCPSWSFAKKQVDRLENIFYNDLLPAKDRLPPHEFYNIDQYHDALHTAFAVFLDGLINQEYEETTAGGETEARELKAEL